MANVLKLATPHQVKRVKRSNQLLLCEAPNQDILYFLLKAFQKVVSQKRMFKHKLKKQNKTETETRKNQGNNFQKKICNTNL